SAVDHAGDVAVELDVVEIKLRGFDFKRLFFVEVAQVQKFFVTIERIVVEVDFRIKRDESLVFRQQERIDLHQRGIHLLVSRVERLHELRCLIDKLRRNADSERQLSCLK